MTTLQTRAKRGTPENTLRAVEQRLAAAEQQLQLQFARMAQIQAALDLLQAALRRSPAQLDPRGSGAGRSGAVPHRPAVHNRTDARD